MLLTQELLRNVQCSGSSVSFAKKMRALKMSTVADHLRLTWPIEKTVEADPLKTAGKLLKNSTSTILWSLGIWSKLDRWKSLSGCLTSWPKVKIKKKKSLFWSVVFSYCTQQQIISQPDCDMRWKWILYNWWWPAQWLDQEAPKHFLKPNFYYKMVMVTVWSAACLIPYSFLNSTETITAEKYAQQINEMHQKLQGQQLVLVNSSVVQSCPTLCNPMDCSMPGFPVHRQLLVFTQAHVHWVGDAI